MGKPSSRVFDQHICPMLDGPKPHVGGNIIPPGTPTVLVGGVPVATLGDMCLCVSLIPNAIATGSMGVWIGGRPAARMFEKTLHGGTLIKGLPSVLIGDMSAVAGPAIYPGPQKYSNCGLQCVQQVFRQTLCNNEVWDETAFLLKAIEEGYVLKADTLKESGATQPLARHALLAAHGVDSTTVASPNPSRALSMEEDEQIQQEHNIRVREALTKALQESKGVIVGLDASQLWHGKADGSGHAVLVTDADFDGEGNVTHFYINDTSAPDLKHRQGYCIPAEDFWLSLELYKDFKNKKPGSCLNIIDTPMWNSTPIKFDPLSQLDTTS